MLVRNFGKLHKITLFNRQDTLLNTANTWEIVHGYVNYQLGFVLSLAFKDHVTHVLHKHPALLDGLRVNLKFSSTCRKQLFQYIQPDYYGWRDEEDGMLVLAEQMFEEQSATG